MSKWTAVAALLFSGQVFAEITVTDSRGEHTLTEQPQRVVVLNWDLAEQVLELDVTPVGMPNISGYQEWVVQPAVPAGVADIGTRTEPNLEKIAELKPDLILAASPQKDLIPRLEALAPVLYYETYSQSLSSAEAAIANFRQLATVFDQEALAEQKLTAMSERFTELKNQLNQAFNGESPSVVAMRFANQTSVYIYGQNSTTNYALEQLGLTPAMPLPATEWGIVQKRLTDLQKAGSSYVLYFRPFNEEKQLQRSVIWNAMPFVRAKHVNSVTSVWNYGGAMSIRYIAEAMADSLFEIAPDQDVVSSVKGGQD
ncbi:iron-siderophore ABC transporter substrate-binding protein [Photobacterium sp. CAU 1568]|uniref:Iron-siderophore ABC transporter substrate-binding protein n=1 Tax=Photobacterium arenosum TaxID=2774143 RepID=A0ABR9BSJ4_9GAMM|nr:iron-siderophore ABC transporter substrate-binding protein [Photobacterium arenosum]MBD8514551.1 iron-siderophore ABC transporter substrate-binding protein [Photobacterium arenosum]